MKPRGIDLGTNQPLPPALVGVMVLLDRSGSMSSIQAQMEQSFADFVNQQKSLNPDGMWITLHQFDTGNYDVCYDRTPLADVGPLNLLPRGGTPLRDALWDFGHHARQVIDDQSDPTERLLLVIITDGEENSSRHHTWEQVEELIKGLKSADCEVIWLGTTEAVLEAKTQMPTAMPAGAMLAYAASDAGVQYATGGLSASVTAYRSGTSAVNALADYTSRFQPNTATMTDEPDWLQSLTSSEAVINHDGQTKIKP